MSNNKSIIHHVPSAPPLAFKAAFADFKLVKTRKTAQFIFEVPIEGADAALGALGGLPRPDAEVWAAIARLDPALAASEPRNAPVEASTPKERKPFKSLPLAQQAAMRCGDVEFRRFLAQRGGISGITILSLDMAADDVRAICDVTSRSKISDADESGDKWRRLDAEFQNWKHTMDYNEVAR